MLSYHLIVIGLTITHHLPNYASDHLIISSLDRNNCFVHKTESLNHPNVHLCAIRAVNTLFPSYTEIRAIRSID